jgi:Cu2+-containing amine oxidase
MNFTLKIVRRACRCVGLLPVASFCSAQPKPHHLLPLDPLTSDERAVAVKIVESDKRVQELIGTGRREIVSIALFAQKGSRQEIEAAAAGKVIPMSRSVEVILFRYEGEVGVRAIVDLTHKKVSDVGRLPSKDVPMTQAELIDAWRLASRDSEVREALGANFEKFQVLSSPVSVAGKRPPYRVEGLRLEGAIETDPCYRHRCLQLLFRSDAGYLMQPVVVVDLSVQKVQVERREQ